MSEENYKDACVRPFVRLSGLNVRKKRTGALRSKFGKGEDIGERGRVG